MIKTYKEYTAAKQNFLRRHGRDGWAVETSGMNKDGVYYKTYLCADGGQWFERMAPAWKKATAAVEVVPGVTVDITEDIKLFETEYFNSDNPNSFKYYEKF